jgi:4-amino-4-deoxy-L-arabinose transferase-like glycosyltransferase
MPDKSPSSEPRTDGARRWRDRIVAAAMLVPIVLVALYLRLAGLGSQQLYGDEAEYAIVARYLSRDLAFLAYPAIEGFAAVPFVSQPPLVLYSMAFSMKIFGPTDFAAVLPSVLFGVATVLVVYALGARLSGRLAGVASAALLAVLPFHVELSRKAQLDAGFAFFLVLTAYFLVAWMQSRRASAEAPDDVTQRKRARWHAVGVGGATAGAALSKLPGVLAGPVVLLALLVVAIVVAVRVARRRATKGEAKELALHAGLGAAPVALGAFLYLGLLAYLEAITNLWLKLRWQLGRVDTSQATTRELAAVERPFDWYFTNEHQSFTAQFGNPVLVLALIGLGIALFLFATNPSRRTEYLVTPLMCAVLLGFFLWSDRKEGFYLLPFAPFVAHFVGLSAGGLRAMLRWAGIRFAPGIRRHVAPFALAAGLVVVAYPAYGAAVDSYEDFVLNETQQKYFGYGTKEAALLIAERDPDAGQYGTLLGRFTLHWYNEQDTYHWYVDHTFIESKVQSGELRYVVYDDYLDLAHDREFMQMLIQKYNGKAIHTYREGWGELTVFELHP